MPSKNDYNKVIRKATKKRLVTENIFASIGASPRIRAEALQIATNPTVQRRAAISQFDRETMTRAQLKNAAARKKR